MFKQPYGCSFLGGKIKISTDLSNNVFQFNFFLLLIFSLQAFAQIPDLNVWYGPDSYMGANIAKLFQQMTVMSDAEIAGIHPKHNRDSIKSLLPRLHYYQVKILFLVLEE